MRAFLAAVMLVAATATAARTQIINGEDRTPPPCPPIAGFACDTRPLPSTEEIEQARSLQRIERQRQWEEEQERGLCERTEQRVLGGTQPSGRSGQGSTTARRRNL